MTVSKPLSDLLYHAAESTLTVMTDDGPQIHPRTLCKADINSVVEFYCRNLR